MARVSGLISGLDTDALIQELVAAYETKQQSYEKKQTKLGWKQEAWKSLNTKVYSFYTGALNTARFSSAYSAKKATISDSTKATVSASSDAVEGTQTLKINKLAKTAYLTGGVVNGKDGEKLTANSKIGEGLGIKEGASIEVNGKNITFRKDTTINQFVAQLKDAGVNASFDATNQRFFISGKKSGVEGEFSITASNAEGLNALNALGLNAASTQDVKAYVAGANMNVENEAKAAYVASVVKDAGNILALREDALKYASDQTYQTQKNEAWVKKLNEYQKTKEELLNATKSGEGEGAASVAWNDLVKKDTDGKYVVNSENPKLKQGADGNYTYTDNGKTITFTKKEVDAQLNTLNVANAGIEGMKKEIASYAEVTGLSIAVTQKTQDEQIKDAAGNVIDTIKAGSFEIKTTGTAKTDIENNNQELKENIETLLTTNSSNVNNDDINDALRYVLVKTKVTTSDMVSTNEQLKTFIEGQGSYTNLKDQYTAEKEANTTQLNQVLTDIANSGKVQGLATNADGTVTYQSKAVTADADDRLYYSDGNNKIYLTVSEDGTISVGDENNATTIDSLYETALAGGNSTSSSGAVRVNGTDAEIELNGAVFTSNTNNFSINGLTITATGETAEAITLSTTTDIDGMYDSIKKLISGYNDILKEMNTMYYADSSKGYEPLTDDEKEAMSDDEIEKWEKKIKDSLLRRDDTLGNIMNGMKNVTSKSYEINGKTYSLSTFGIATSGYFSVNNEERGLFHIDGDKDDSTSSGNKDKLRAALATDSGSVIQFFQKLADDLYSDLTNRMKRTSLSSSYTLYNDKQLQKQYEEYDDIIDEWDEKIEKYTEKYVKQFTAMEKAMAQLQSSTSQLTGMLG